jgi:hypothetical protein
VGSVANLSNDTPGLAWRFGLTAPHLIIDLGASPVSYDHVALFGANLRATDTVRVQTGATTTGTGAYDSTPIAAYTGFKDATTSTKVVIKLPALRTERYIRIDLSAPAHPSGYVQFSRLIIGAATVTDGVDYDAEQGFEAQSVITTGPGYRSVDAYAPLDSWKLSTGWISDESWRTQWAPMLRYAALGGGILFIPDNQTPANYQNDALFGFFMVPSLEKPKPIMRGGLRRS